MQTGEGGKKESGGLLPCRGEDVAFDRMENQLGGLGKLPLEREVYFDYLHAVVLKLEIAFEVNSVDVGGGNLLFPYYEVDAVNAL